MVAEPAAVQPEGRREPREALVGQLQEERQPDPAPMLEWVAVLPGDPAAHQSVRLILIHL